jgi:hypothetical protein
VGAVLRARPVFYPFEILINFFALGAAGTGAGYFA